MRQPERNQYTLVRRKKNENGDSLSLERFKKKYVRQQE